MTEPLQLPSLGYLLGLVGKQFTADRGGHFRLESVGRARRQHGFESFALEFSALGSTGGPLPGQGMQTVEVPGHGKVEVFLVPIAPERYEAAVTRTVPA